MAWKGIAICTKGPAPMTGPNAHEQIASGQGFRYKVTFVLEGELIGRGLVDGEFGKWYPDDQVPKGMVVGSEWLVEATDFSHRTNKWQIRTLSPAPFPSQLAKDAISLLWWVKKTLIVEGVRAEDKVARVLMAMEAMHVK